MNIERAINYLIRHHGLKLPHGIMPGRFPGGLGGEFHRGVVERLSMEPGSRVRAPWDRCRRKRQAVMGGAGRRQLERPARGGEGRGAAVHPRGIDLSPHSRRLRAGNLEDETLFRLANRQTAEQDAERVRLQAVAKALKAKVAAATTLAALWKITPWADAVWAKPKA